MSSRVNKEAEFAYGTGQLNPTKAVSPGLVYDMDPMSNVQFLYHEGYNGSSIGTLIGSKPINCSALLPGLGEDAFNCPIAPTVGVFRRRVTNVGQSLAVYNATVRAPAGVEVTVAPMSLSFSRALQRRSFKIVVKATHASRNARILSGSLTWRSRRHSVRSPIVVYNPKED